MDNNPAVFSDDDEYDLISNPGHDQSLESSIAGLPSKLQAKDIPEPPPAQAARDKIETVNWSADEIQVFVRKSLNLAPETHSRKTVRIYVDGAFDVFNVGSVEFRLSSVTRESDPGHLQTRAPTSSSEIGVPFRPSHRWGVS